MERRGGLLWLWFVALVGLFQACDSVPAPSTESVVDRADGAGTAAVSEEAVAVDLGDGFLVWESNRSGAWRIWTRSLSGGPARQLTADERGRQHYAPHISTDGRSVAYLSVLDKGRSYPEGGAIGELRLIPAPGPIPSPELSPAGDSAPVQGGEARLLVERARTYHENRAVVWRSPTDLIFIGEDLRTYLLDVESGERRPLMMEPSPDLGVLVDAELAHASSNDVTFSVYDAERRSVVPRVDLGGCQPYFSHDGRWGVWTGGAGGPILKIDLDSRRIDKLIDKNDTRLPDGWGYLYFPMPSRDGSLLALAASRDGHDHFESDYEIFVFETDPATLSPIGEGLRFTRHPGTDRYPDLFRESLPLGRHRGEAPFEITLTAPDGKSRSWFFGDGAAEGAISEGVSGRHLYERPGRYSVEARRDGAILRGRVIVAPGRPPEVLSSRFSGDGRRLTVEFDEPVQAERAAVNFESGRAIVGLRSGADGRFLVLDLEAPFAGSDRLILADVEDRASRPHVMGETVVEIGPPRWPLSREGLVFLWETGNAPNLVPDPESGVDRAVTLLGSGTALLDHHWAMRPGAGHFAAAAGDIARLRRVLQSANEMSLEFTLTPDPAAGRVRVVSFADQRRQNFRLELEGRRLIFHLRTGSRGPNANSRIELFTLPDDRPSHIVVTYSPAGLSAYLNGERRRQTGPGEIRGDFFHWRDLPLTFGGGRAGDLRLEGLAIYDRLLSAEEIEAHAGRYRTQIANRTVVPEIVVEARLVGRTPAPRLEEISPYREALVVYEYEVSRIVNGDPASDRLRVAHWSILDGGRTALNDRSLNEIYRLRLEPFAANPQLASLYLGEAGTIDAQWPLFYAPDPTD